MVDKVADKMKCLMFDRLKLHGLQAPSTPTGRGSSLVDFLVCADASRDEESPSWYSSVLMMSLVLLAWKYDVTCVSAVGLSVTCRRSVGVGGATMRRLARCVAAREGPGALVSSSTVFRISA